MKLPSLLIILFFSSINYAQQLDFAYTIGGSYEDKCYDMGIDNQKNIYITGGFCNEVNFNPNGTPFYLNSKNIDRSNTFVAKYDSNFTLIWAFSIQGDAWWELGHCLGVDDSLNVYVIGNYEGNVDFDPSENHYILSSSEMSYYLAKYSSEGKICWVRDIGNYPESYLVVPPRNSIVIDKNSNIYLSHGDSLHKYNSMGDLLWSKPYKGKAVFNGDKSLYILTNSEDPWNSVKYDSLRLVKIDTSGQILLDKTIIKNQIGDINGFLTFDKRGHLLINGDFWGTSVFYDNNQNITLVNEEIGCCPSGPGQGCSDCPLNHEYFAKFDTIGNVIWAYDFGENGPNPYIIETTTDGTIYSLGFLNFSADFDPAVSVAQLTNSGYGNYIAKYDSSCNFLAAAEFMGGSYNDFIGKFEIQNDLSAYICGHFFNTIDLNLNERSNTLYANPPEDIFIAKYSDFDIKDFTTISINKITDEPDIIVYPNPSKNYLYIKNNNIQIEKISVQNINGQTLLMITKSPGKPIDISQLKEGLYLVKIELKDKIEIKKIIKE